MKKCFKSNQQAGKLIVKQGKADNKWLFSISSVMVMYCMILKVSLEGLTARADDYLATAPKGLRTLGKQYHYGIQELVRMLGEIQSTFFGNGNEFRLIMKSSLVFMYTIKMIQEEKVGIITTTKVEHDNIQITSKTKTATSATKKMKLPVKGMLFYSIYSNLYHTLFNNQSLIFLMSCNIWFVCQKIPKMQR